MPFFAADRSWARVDLVVHGTPRLPHDAERALVVADPPGRMSE